MEQLVLTSRRDGIAIVSMNRPEKRNALSAAMSIALFEQLTELERDPACRCIVLTGEAGEFCAGGDLGETAVDSLAAGRARMALTPRVVKLLAGGPKPTIAAVEGHAIGAGMALAIACDYVVTSVEAKFAASFARVGLGVDGGLSWTLPRRVGLGQTKRLLLTGATIDGEEAVRIGAAEEACAPGTAVDSALVVAGRFAGSAPLAIATTKQILAQGFATLEQSLSMESDFQASLFMTEDAAEGRRALTERRRPEFKGR